MESLGAYFFFWMAHSPSTFLCNREKSAISRITRGLVASIHINPHRTIPWHNFNNPSKSQSAKSALKKN
jgi:hypothetical protein